MQQKNSRFPWGIYIGNLTDNGHTLPLFLPALRGGFSLFFDDESEMAANSFIENTALRLHETVSGTELKTTVFDFGYKKRFPELSLLKEANLYDIALTADAARQKFTELEKISLYRHHELLSPEILTISDYNHFVQSDKREPYCLLLLNLDHFPQTVIPQQKIKAFFDAAFEAGFYTIAFGNKALLEQEEEKTYFQSLFPSLEFRNKKLSFNDTLPEFQELTQQHCFKPLDTDKAKLRNQILHTVNAHETAEKNPTLLQEVL